MIILSGKSVKYPDDEYNGSPYKTRPNYAKCDSHNIQANLTNKLRHKFPGYIEFSLLNWNIHSSILHFPQFPHCYATKV